MFRAIGWIPRGLAVVILLRSIASAPAEAEADS